MANAKSVAEVKDGAVYVLQPGTPVYVKTADVCAMIGKSNQWVGQLTSQGTIVKKQTSHGAMYEVSQTMAGYCTMLENRTDEKDEKEQEIEQQRRKAEATLKKAKATVASLDAQERLGKMHRSEDVAAMTEDLIFAVRGSLLALPGRLAVDVVAAKDSAEASEIIRREVYKIMEDLSSYRYDAAKYEERVRERLKMDASVSDADDDEES